MEIFFGDASFPLECFVLWYCGIGWPLHPPSLCHIRLPECLVKSQYVLILFPISIFWYSLYTLHFIFKSISLTTRSKERVQKYQWETKYRIYLADQKKNGEISKHDSSNDDAARFHALTGVVWGALCTLHFAPACTSSKATDWVTPGRSPAVITPPHSPAQAQSITHSPPGSWSTWLFRFWVG